MNRTSNPALAALLAVTLALSACGGDSDDTIETGADAITITSVTPDAVADGVPVTVTVNFNYRLQTKPKGIVYLGFNTTGEADTYILAADRLTVGPGTGSSSLVAVVQPKYLAAPNAFQAYVNLSESPHADRWTPLASDRRALTVTPSAQPTAAVGRAGTADGDGLVCAATCTGSRQ